MDPGTWLGLGEILGIFTNRNLEVIEMYVVVVGTHARNRLYWFGTPYGHFAINSALGLI